MQAPVFSCTYSSWTEWDGVVVCFGGRYYLLGSNGGICMRSRSIALILALAAIVVIVAVPAEAARKKSPFDACVDSCVDKRTACIKRNYEVYAPECKDGYSACVKDCH